MDMEDKRKYAPDYMSLQCTLSNTVDSIEKINAASGLFCDHASKAAFDKHKGNAIKTIRQAQQSIEGHTFDQVKRRRETNMKHIEAENEQLKARQARLDATAKKNNKTKENTNAALWQFLMTKYPNENEQQRMQRLVSIFASGETTPVKNKPATAAAAAAAAAAANMSPPMSPDDPQLTGAAHAAAATAKGPMTTDNSGAAATPAPQRFAARIADVAVATRPPTYSNASASTNASDASNSDAIAAASADEGTPTKDEREEPKKKKNRLGLIGGYSSSDEDKTD